MKFLPFSDGRDIRMGAGHPVAWTHCVGRGRAFYSALGHRPEAYSETKHLQMIRGAIAWAAGFEGPECGELDYGPSALRNCWRRGATKSRKTRTR